MTADPTTTAPASGVPAAPDTSTSVVGLFTAVTAAERVAAALADADVPDEDVQLVVPPPRPPEYAVERRTKAPEGALVGAAAGGALGFLLGFLAGSGVVALPGLGALLAAGPVLAGLSTSAVTAVLVGLAGAAVGARLPEYEALPREREHHEKPRAVVSVRCRTAAQLERVRAIVESLPNDGVTVSEESEAPLAPRAP